LQTGGTGSAGQSLANTGTASSTPMMVLWGVLLLVFGRMVVLTAKPIRLVDER
jgi:LPXTG-motif cell wall-anchored protein